MGWFGGFVKKVCNGAKAVASNIVDGAKKVGNYVGDKIEKGKNYIVEKVREIKTKVSNTAAKWSGKEEADKAKALYEKIEKRYNEEKQSYEITVDKYSAKIKEHVYNINFYKERIKSELLPEFIKSLEKFCDFPIPESLKMEEYEVETLKVEEMKSKSDLISIDWDENYWTNTLKAIFTLGLWTKKKAKDSLDKVKEEEYKVEENIVKMQTEKSRLADIDKALGNTEYYFKKVIEYYEIMLVRLDNAINTLYVRCLAKMHSFVHQEMSLRRLTRMQQKELEAAVTASVCLKAMMDVQVLVTDKFDVEKRSDEVKAHYETVEKEYQAA